MTLSSSFRRAGTAEGPSRECGPFALQEGKRGASSQSVVRRLFPRPAFQSRPSIPTTAPAANRSSGWMRVTITSTNVAAVRR
jgi:hypothetical protein